MNKQAGHRSEVSSLMHGTMPKNTISLHKPPSVPTSPGASSIGYRWPLAFHGLNNAHCWRWTEVSLWESDGQEERKRVAWKRTNGPRNTREFLCSWWRGEMWRMEEGGERRIRTLKKGVCMNKHLGSKSNNWRGRNLSSFDRCVKGCHLQILSRLIFFTGIERLKCRQNKGAAQLCLHDMTHKWKGVFDCMVEKRWRMRGKGRAKKKGGAREGKKD